MKKVSAHVNVKQLYWRKETTWIKMRKTPAQCFSYCLRCKLINIPLFENESCDPPVIGRSLITGCSTNLRAFLFSLVQEGRGNLFCSKAALKHKHNKNTIGWLKILKQTDNKQNTVNVQFAFYFYVIVFLLFALIFPLEQRWPAVWTWKRETQVDFTQSWWDLSAFTTFRFPGNVHSTICCCY